MSDEHQLTADERKRAISLAATLANDADRNEFAKAVNYLRRTGDADRFQKLLQRLPRSRFVRTQRTQRYFETIARACSRELGGLDSDRAALVALWAVRLMAYEEQRGGGAARRR